MKRLGYLAVLMVLSSSASSAQAGDSYSFVVGGRRIHIEAHRGCRSLSCVSWSNAGKRNRRDCDDDDDAAPAKPTVTATAKPQPELQPQSMSAEAQQEPARAVVQAPAGPAQQGEPARQAQAQPNPTTQMQAPQVQVAPLPPAQAPAPVAIAPPATKLASETVAPPPAAPKPMELTSTTTQSVPSATPKTEPETEAKIVVLERPAGVTLSAPPTAPAKLKDEKETANTPLGDWQTAGNKGLVRIEQCGKSLCGYVLNGSTNSKGETLLANMTSKSVNQWTGDIYSRASGNGYYAKMTLRTPNTLHVEACAVLRFFCSGNDWTRIMNAPDEVIISRQSTSEPSS